MASFNKITIVGYLGRDPETRYTPNGDAVCSFSIATTEKRKDEEFTTWFNVSVWGKSAEACQKYLTKGSQVYVEGRLMQRTYQKQDGTPGVSLDVKAGEVNFLSSKSDAEQTPQQAAFAAQAPSGPRKVASKKPQDEFRGGGVDDSDEIPF